VKYQKVIQLERIGTLDAQAFSAKTKKCANKN
jgi:hypothetical protein